MKTENRFGFTKGARVVATERAYQNGVFKRKHAPVFGTVTGFGVSHLTLIVRRDNRKLASAYHINFWKLSPPSSTGSPDA